MSGTQSICIINIQRIKELTGATLDMSLEKHRDYRKSFNKEILNVYNDSVQTLKRKSFISIVKYSCICVPIILILRQIMITLDILTSLTILTLLGLVMLDWGDRIMDRVKIMFRIIGRDEFNRQRNKLEVDMKEKAKAFHSSREL